MKSIQCICLLTMLLFGHLSYANVAEERAESDQMVVKTLKAFRNKKPNIDSEIKSSVGYAVFSNAGVNLFFVSAGGGYGVAFDNQKGGKTYMNMGEAGVGIGLGVKDFRALILFKTRKAFEAFVEDGWLFGAQADAAAKAEDKGGSAEVEAAIGDTKIYQLTEAGLSAEATIKGTKFWKDEDLN
ncbi:hypothetical protein HR060_02645 [Catenovulum sp. SM1970]|uniref:lipid-binding SYLF domain-containing protein n=1 Tax=Marinifaba aquimaris TaxID=2741323 RepID=UPI0015721F60|nr:YSC84-related protein [Marinifaba aquimaris]NTS75754.1 hypothetical protein [Marinifaba aquimaris]